MGGPKFVKIFSSVGSGPRLGPSLAKLENNNLYTTILCLRLQAVGSK